MQGVDRLPSDPFRPDLEGLRGVAILVVLAFHAGLPLLAGGFIGVDVFFVLSGFLITGLLLRERERSGRIDLGAFYARRARRILPAAAVVLVATLGASSLVLSPLDMIRVADDALASALSLGNIRFAQEATDYFAAGVTPSPFLHYWSLGVEEQFYLLYPALLIGATALPRPRLAAGLLLALLALGSFGLALVLTDASPAWAFYSLPSRAWQLALGGLLAVLATRPQAASPGSARRGIPGPALAALGWAGLGAIGASVVLIDPATPYPGLAALVPSLGAAALIATGGLRFSPGALLVLPPLRFLGRISYSLYLVHWPILVLPAAGLAIGEELPIGGRLALAGVALVAGSLCYRFVELPVHRGHWFSLPPGRSLALAGATVAVSAVIALGVGTLTSRELDSSLAAAETVGSDASAPEPGAEVALGSDPDEEAGADDTEASPGTDPQELPTPAAGAAPVESTEPDQSTDPDRASGPVVAGEVAGATSAPPDGTAGSGVSAGPVVSGVSPGSSTASASAAPPPAAAVAQPPPAATAAPAPTLPARHPSGPQPLPAGVRPSLLRAAKDEERLVTNRCNAQPAQVNPRDCSFGNPNGTVTLALVGDSHTSQWFPAVEQVAKDRGWRLVTFTKYDCRFMDIRTHSAFLKREYTECAAWREVVVQRLNALQPQLVIVGVSRFPRPIDPADADPVRQGRALARVLARVPGQHAILVDTPRANVDVPPCISSHRADVTPCETLRTAAFYSRHRIVERTAAEIDDATLIDLSDRICPWSRCPVVLNGMIIYRDNHHLTATFAASLADAFAATLPDIEAPVGAVRPFRDSPAAI